MGLKLAIVGATGLVGQELLAVIDELEPRLDKLGLYASSSSTGIELLVNDQPHRVSALDDCDFGQYDAALFSVGDNLSAQYVPIALKAGCKVIDKSNAFRLDPDVPLVVPGVNEDAVTKDAKLVANPNCTTIILSHALAPIKKSYGLKQVFAATYQSVSGAGKTGLLTLFDELKEAGYDEGRFRPDNPFLGQKPAFDDCYTQDQNPLPGLIAHNVHPQIGKLDADLRCGEEVKLIKESRKILGLPELQFFAHSVRVPVPVGHSIAVTFQTERPAAGFIEMSATLVAYDYVDYTASQMPTPLDCAWREFGNVDVGRLRQEDQLENGWSMFVCGDNLRMGAAHNGWRILELMARVGAIPEFVNDLGENNG